MPSFYPSRKLSKYWWSYWTLQFPALIIFSMPDFVVPGMWTPNRLFLFCLIVSFLFIHYLHIFCCLAKPITPLCWYLLVLGYLSYFILYLLLMYIYVQSDEWYFSLLFGTQLTANSLSCTGLALLPVCNESTCTWHHHWSNTSGGGETWLWDDKLLSSLPYRRKWSWRAKKILTSL